MMRELLIKNEFLFRKIKNLNFQSDGDLLGVHKRIVDVKIFSKLM